MNISVSSSDMYFSSVLEKSLVYKIPQYLKPYNGLLSYTVSCVRDKPSDTADDVVKTEDDYLDRNYLLDYFWVAKISFF